MQLYQIKGTDKFGAVLATDSKGMKIFEVKGGGIEVVTAEQIEEVFPFTFAVSFVGVENISKEYHFQGNSDEVKVGDLLVYEQGATTLGICRVTKVDTKSRSATKRFSGYKLQASKLN